MASVGTIGRTDGQKSMWVVGFAHGTTHWILATFFVVLPFVSDDLSLSYTQAGLLVSTYYLTSFAANLFSGAVVDLTGRKIVFLVAAVLAGAAAVIGFALSAHFALLCLMMVVIGTAVSFWHAPAISFLSKEFPARRGYALSIHAFFASGADAFAPLVAGVVIAAAAWQGAIASAAVPALVAAVMLLALLPHDRAAAEGDGGGMGLAGYRAGIATLLRDRAVLGLALMAGFRSMSQAGLLVFLPLYLANDLEVSPVALGAALMAMQLGGMIAGPIAGVASDRVGRRPVVMAGLTVSTLIVIGITLVGNTAVFVGGVSVLGFALFAVRPVIQSWMMDLVPPAMGASGTSLLFATQSVLSTLTPIVGGFIGDRWGLVSVFYFLAGSMLVANLAVVALPKQAERD